MTKIFGEAKVSYANVGEHTKAASTGKAAVDTKEVATDDYILTSPDDYESLVSGSSANDVAEMADVDPENILDEIANSLAEDEAAPTKKPGNPMQAFIGGLIDKLGGMDSKKASADDFSCPFVPDLNTILKANPAIKSNMQPLINQYIALKKLTMSMMATNDYYQKKAGKVAISTDKIIAMREQGKRLSAALYKTNHYLKLAQKISGEVKQEMETALKEEELAKKVNQHREV